MGYDRNKTALNSTISSTYTSSDYFVVDAATLSVSWTTVNAVASRLTIEASNDNGFTGAITNRSTLTALTAQGFYTLDPGARFVRFRRGSEESTATVQLQTWNN